MTAAGATALTYDGRGNLTGSGATTYAYTSENRLARKGSDTTLAYDSVGRLSAVDTYDVNGNPATTTGFNYDGAALIAEHSWPSGSVLRRYVHGPGEDQPIVWYEGSGTTDKRWLIPDERGSVVAVTNSTGAAMSINAYDEYGIPQSTNVGRFGYTGQTWLPEIGMNYYKARMYSPTLGRFMQTDPIGYGDGVNWYAYVGSDPVNGRDTTGLKCSGTLSDSCKIIYVGDGGAIWIAGEGGRIDPATGDNILDNWIKVQTQPLTSWQQIGVLDNLRDFHTVVDPDFRERGGGQNGPSNRKIDPPLFYCYGGAGTSICTTGDPRKDRRVYCKTGEMLKSPGGESIAGASAGSTLLSSRSPTISAFSKVLGEVLAAAWVYGKFLTTLNCY